MYNLIFAIARNKIFTIVFTKMLFDAIYIWHTIKNNQFDKNKNKYKFTNSYDFNQAQHY